MMDGAHGFDPATAEDGIELVFDDAPTPAKAKRIRTARTTPAAPQLSADTATEPARPPVADRPVDEEPAAPSAAAVLPLPYGLLAGALVVALLSAVIAAVGLLMATRTIAQSQATARAAEQQAARLERLPATLASLDRVIAGEQAALAQLAQGRAGQPATVGDLQRELDRLRTAIAEHKPQQDMALLNVTKAGQAEISERLGAIQDAMDKLPHGGGGAH